MTLKERWTGFVSKLKGARKSLTIWANTAAAVAIYNLQTIADVLTGAHSLLSPDDYRYAAWAIVVINYLLRFKTKKALHEK